MWVTLEDGKDGQVQEFVGLGADRSPSTKCKPKSTAGGGLDLAHDETVDDLAQNRNLALLDPEGSVEDGLFEGATLVDLGQNALLDRFPDSRDPDHDGRSELAKIALAVPHGSIGQGLDPPISEGHANRQKDELDDVFHNVREGQEREEGVIWSELVFEEFVHSSKDGHEIGVSDDDTLGVSGGSTGVHDAVYVIRLGGTRLGLLLRDCDAFSAFAQLLNGKDCEVRAGSFDPLKELRLGLAVVDHKLDGRGVGEDIREYREKIGVGENSDTFWLV